MDILIISTQRGAEALAPLLKEYGLREQRYAVSGGEARRLLRECNFELIVVNTPLPDEYGAELSAECARRTDAGVVLLAPAVHADETSARVEDDGVFVVAKPFGRAILFQAIKLAQASRRRIVGLRRENERLQEKLTEMRLAGRAKAALMRYLNMTEDQAHRYLEKQAMDLRISKGDAARNVLAAYEDAN